MVTQLPKIIETILLALLFSYSNDSFCRNFNGEEIWENALFFCAWFSFLWPFLMPLKQSQRSSYLIQRTLFWHAKWHVLCEHAKSNLANKLLNYFLLFVSAVLPVLSFLAKVKWYMLLSSRCQSKCQLLFTCLTMMLGKPPPLLDSLPPQNEGGHPSTPQKDFKQAGKTNSFILIQMQMIIS